MDALQLIRLLIRTAPNMSVTTTRNATRTTNNATASRTATTILMKMLVIAVSLFHKKN